MPMDFPDMNSLKRCAEVHKFRKPKDGESEKDFREAFRNYLSIQISHGWIVGCCVACGPKTDKTSLKKMLELLSRYVPIDFRSKKALNHIFHNKHSTQWNTIADYSKGIPSIPLATGLMLAELKEAPGILHTLNLIFLESGSLKLFRIVEKNRLNEMVEVATDDIKEPHLVIM